ncbi:hypothetical protein ABTF01_20560, partial [Acinetobacter baumannii]
DVIASLYGENSRTIAFTLYDGVTQEAQALLYQSPLASGPMHRPRLQADEYRGVANHNWTLSMSTTDAFTAQFGRNAEQLIAVTGIA